MALKAQFQMLVVALDLALHISYPLDFRYVQVLVQDWLLKGLPKVMIFLEDVRRCYLQCTYIKKEEIRLFLTGLFSLI